MKATTRIGLLVIVAGTCLVWAGPQGAPAFNPGTQSAGTQPDDGHGDRIRLGDYYAPFTNPVQPGVQGYTLPIDLEQVSNYATIKDTLRLEAAAPALSRNGFAILQYDSLGIAYLPDDIVDPYKRLRQLDVPLFITADTLLHLYHVQFDETLKDVEEREFFWDILDLTGVMLTEALAQHDMYDGDLKEAAKRNVAYLAVAHKLIEPSAQTPALTAEMVDSELAKIDAHVGFGSSDIFKYQEDYSQYVPRGHYTRSEQLKRYFKTLMWYGRMAFLLKGAENWGPAREALISTYDARIQTLQAVLLAQSLQKVQVGPRSGSQVWERMYAVTAFYVGLADDLTPYEYLDAIAKVFGADFAVTDLTDDDNFFALKTELALLRSPQIFGGTGNVVVMPPITPESLDEVLDKTKGMRFMGQRFIPDSYMFQQLVFPAVGPYVGDGVPMPFTLGETGVGPGRCYPCGLDVMAVLGSDLAEAILAEQGDTDYVGYAEQIEALKAEFDALDQFEWNRNLYWSWLYSLKALLGEYGEGYPAFMQTEAWRRKQLNSVLASWAELRHDTILYAKQSYTPVGTGMPPPPRAGYVEPVPEFYGRLLMLTRMTKLGLKDFHVLTRPAAGRLMRFELILIRLILIANKELTNVELSDADQKYIKNFAAVLEGAVVGVDDAGVKTTLVADVHTHIVESQVVEEGVGNVDLIVVACPGPDGSISLAAGPVLSYYEFKHPMSDRLTDEAWRELLTSPQRPARPDWINPLLH